MFSARHDKPVKQAFCGVRKCYLVKPTEFGSSLLILKRDSPLFALTVGGKNDRIARDKAVIGKSTPMFPHQRGAGRCKAPAEVEGRRP